MTTFPRKLVLKEGAQVMLLKNTSETLVNGSRGVVVKFVEAVPGTAGGERLPLVRFLSGEEMLVKREEDKKDVGRGQAFVRRQVPLRLSWAITIHKSQGMSI